VDISRSRYTLEGAIHHAEGQISRLHEIFAAQERIDLASQRGVAIEWTRREAYPVQVKGTPRPN